MDVASLTNLIPYAVIALSAVVGGMLYAKYRRGEGTIAALEGREFVTLRLMVPKINEKGPLAAEQMFAALHGIFREKLPAQEHVSLEVASDGHSIQFYAFVPRHFRNYLESQIYAQYPQVEIAEVADYTTDLPFREEMKVAGTVLKLSKEEFFPIKTFPNFEVDPLAGITAVLSDLAAGERIWIQFLFEPADTAWTRRALEYIRAVKKGLEPYPKLSFSPLDLTRSLFKFVVEVLSQMIQGPPQPKLAAGSPPPTLSGPEEQAIKGIETKITKLGFRSLIRVIVLSPELEMAKAKALNVVGAFKQFNLTNLNSFISSGITTDYSILEAYRRRSMPEGFVLNTEELASLFHLPHTSVETPTIAWAGSKKGEPPQNLPLEEVSDPSAVTFFAETNFRQKTKRFGIKMPDRRYHLYSIGKTGTGKSTLIENMALDDIDKGRGVAVVDPHGDLIKRILARIPSHRTNDVVYFNPADREFPVAFNLLENVEQDLKGIVASGLMSIFTKLWANVWSARMEYILRNTVLAALDYPDSTLLSVMKILNDPVYRKHVIAKIKDPVIRDFFINEFEKYDPRFRQEAIAPIQNKVGQFLSSATIRNIVGQPHSTVDFEDILNSGKILLINLSIGEIGEDASALLGGMIITKIQLSAMRRATMPEEERKDFYLYVDEFQNFATDSFAIILSEARKYRLNLFLTNQFIAQMPETVKNAVFGNVGTIISFRVGPQDAALLVREFEPVFDANDLVNLSNYQIYLKMTIDGVTSVPFSGLTLAPTASLQGNDEKIVKVSRERYGRDRAFVEKKISEWTEFWENLAREEARAERERKKAARAASRGEEGFRAARPPTVVPPTEAGKPQEKPSSHYIPPPPVRPPIQSPPVVAAPPKSPEEPIAHLSPKLEETIPSKPLDQKKNQEIPAFGARSGEIIPLKEGEEIRLDE